MRLFDTPSSAYLGVLLEILNSPDFRVSPRDKAIREKIAYQFTVEQPDSGPIVTKSAARNEIIVKYLQSEFALYSRGETSVEEFAKASSFWNRLSNPDGSVNSAYGHLIFFDRSCGHPEFEQGEGGDNSTMRSPWEWARLSLLSDKDTRQAIIKFHKRSHLWVGNRDQTCTVYGNFLIRDDKLHLIMHMRSNDAVKGLVYDMPWFCYLLKRMAIELADNGYRNLKVGTYTHIADSMHIYDTDVPKAWDMVGKSE